MGFTVYILSAQLSWKLESVTSLEGDRPLLGPELREAINRARDVICVGTASSEGITQKEEDRAGVRARTLAQWVRGVIQDPGKTRLFAVTAGQYKGPRTQESAIQRKAIIIVAGPHSDGVDLREALNSGLEKKAAEDPTIYSLLHHYSQSGEWRGLR